MTDNYEELAKLKQAAEQARTDYMRAYSDLMRAEREYEAALRKSAYGRAVGRLNMGATPPARPACG